MKLSILHKKSHSLINWESTRINNMSRSLHKSSFIIITVHFVALTYMYPRGSWFGQTWSIYISWGCFHTFYRFYGRFVFRKKGFKDFSLYRLFLAKNVAPIVTPHYFGTHDLTKNWIFPLWGCSHTSYNFSGQVVFWKKNY